MNNQIKTILKIFGSEIGLKIILGITSILIARKLNNNNYSDYFYFLMLTNLSISIPSSFFNKIFFTNKHKVFLEKFDKLSIVLYLYLIAIIFLIVTLTIIPLNNNLLLFISFILIFIRILYLYNQTILQSELNFKKLYSKELIRVVFYSVPTVSYLTINLEPKIEIIIIFLFLSFFFTEITNRISLDKKGYSKKLLDLNKFFFNKKNRYSFLYTISLFVLTSLDTLMLKSLSNEIELSNFGSAFTLYSFLMLGLSSIHKYILPKASISKVSDFQSVIDPILKIGYILILFFIVGIFFSEIVFDLIYGVNKFPNAHVLFNILSLSAVFSFFFSPYSNLLNKLGMFKFQFKLILIGLISLLILNYFLIPDYGAFAVVINNLFVYLFINFSFQLKAKKIIRNLNVE